MTGRLTVGPNPTIEIETVEGDLRLVGWDNNEILVRTDDEAVAIQQDGEHVRITCQDDLALNVPKDSQVHILNGNGDMSVRGLAGDFRADLLNGDVAIRDVGAVAIGTVESDFSLRGATGDVHVKSVGGDASLRDVTGILLLDSISYDLSVQGVGGNLNVNVDGDVVLHLKPKPGQEHKVVAGDDILLVLPADANAALTVSGDQINIQLPEIQSEERTSHILTLGDGSARINLDAGGDVLVTNRRDAAERATEFGNFAGMMFDWGSLGQEIGENWGKYGREVGERVSRQAQEAARRAERKVRHATGRRNARMKWTMDLDNLPKTSKREPVSEEERMTILRMLAEKKITSEEAEKLLSALEGGK